MKHPPSYPDYRAIHPPLKLRWGIALVLVMLLGSILTLWVWPVNQPIKTAPFWFWILGFPALLVGLLFAIRSLIYQVALSNRQGYREVLQLANEHWWQQRSLGLPLEQLCLLGPLGDQPEHHLAVINNDGLPLIPLTLAEGQRSLRCPQILEHDVSRREQALVRHLVLTLLDLPPREGNRAAPVFQAVYWCGASEQGRLFTQLLSEQGWQFMTGILPFNDIDDLDSAIDHFHHLAQDQHPRLLCAGVHQTYLDDHQGVMGEAGFAWIVGPQGTAIIHRAEQQSGMEETPQQITQQLMKYARLASAPEHCISLHQEAAEHLQSAGWPALQQILQPFWGDLQQITPFVASSVAAMQSQETQKSVGWVMRDQTEKSIIGVVSVEQK